LHLLNKYLLIYLIFPGITRNKDAKGNKFQYESIEVELFVTKWCWW